MTFRTAVLASLAPLAWASAAMAQAPLATPPILQAQITLDRPIGGGPSKPPPGAQGGQAGLVTLADPDQIAGIFGELGFTEVKVVELNNMPGKHVSAKANGVPVYAISRCSKSCTAVTFHASFGAQESVDLEWINAYNSQMIFGKMFKFKDGAVALTMDMIYDGGVPLEHVKQNARLFGEVIKSVIEFKPS